MSQIPPGPPDPPGPPGPPDPGFTAVPPKGGMSTGLKALIAGGAVVVLTVVAFLAFGGDDDAVDPDSPAGAVRAFYKALEDKDCDAAVALMSEQLADDAAGDASLADCERDVAEGEDFTMEGVDLEFETKSETGNTAVVDMTATFLGDSVTSSVNLVREDGEWKVAGFAGGGNPEDD